MIKPYRKFALYLLLYLAFTSIAFAQVVDIPDSNLAQAIREELALPAGSETTAQDLRRLTFLDVDNHDITSLSGLEHATNLEDLDIWGNPISDLTPIAKLKRLRVLDAGDCLIGDITPVANLTTLTHLVLRDNQISDINPLVNLTRLRLLLLHDNEIEDISPLANLTNVVELNLRSNSISDISPLSNLTLLEYLDLSHCQIVDISPLANLIQLKVLQLNHNKIVDVQRIAGLRSLYKLEIQDNLIIDHAPLDNLSLDEFVYDQYCDMPPLSLAPRLDNLDFPNTIGASWLYPTDFGLDISFGLADQFFNMDYRRSDNKLVSLDLAQSIKVRDNIILDNPSSIFLAIIPWYSRSLSKLDLESPYWARDINGDIFIHNEGADGFLDYTKPHTQDLIVQMVIEIDRCGLYDGIVLDAWGDGTLLPENTYNSSLQAESRKRILERIRTETRPNFLIQVNSNRDKVPADTAAYINGLSMETGIPNWFVGPNKLNEVLLETESTLLWAESHLRAPRINAVFGEGISTEPFHTASNQRWTRVLTTLGLTHSDGYISYQAGWQVWYNFWAADLGRPVGDKAQLYQETEGLFIREFANGWAVYNRSGEAQVITLPEEVQGVASGLVDTEHTLPNLDGEMYLRVKPKNPADVNRDGTVNILDLVVVAANLSQTGENDADVNGDGVVNILDLVQVAGALGGDGAAPSAYSLDLSMINAADVASWLALAQGSDIGDANFQQGIRFLRQLLAALTPQETTLLPNYPNPFNPETWIPYHLAQETEVAITIYDTKGTLVRRLALGNQAAGHYAERGKAAYWDGRNEDGEAVASGIYFYQFRAGDYVASRRMVILK